MQSHEVRLKQVRNGIQCNFMADEIETGLARVRKMSEDTTAYTAEATGACVAVKSDSQKCHISGK